MSCCAMLICWSLQAADHLSADIPLFHSDVLRPLVVDSMQAAVQQLRRQPSAHDCEVRPEDCGCTLHEQVDSWQVEMAAKLAG